MKYDNLKRDLSFQYNKIIKEYGSQDNIPRIYCDLDGTLCDFVAQLRIITGKSVSEWDRMKNKWDPVLNTPRFWETIPWHKDSTAGNDPGPGAPGPRLGDAFRSPWSRENLPCDGGSVFHCHWL